MKKLIIVLMLLMLFVCFSQNVDAGDNYTTFESITLTNGKLLSDYTSDDLKTAYSFVDKRKFCGWKIYKILEGQEADYRKETLFEYYNNGTTPIEHVFEIVETLKKKTNLSTTGEISVEGKGDVKKFKMGLSSELKMNYSSEETEEKEVKNKITIDVDPGTRAMLYVDGGGKVSNGVAAKYFFWIRIARGGYEVFEITTEYYRLEKVPNRL